MLLRETNLVRSLAAQLEDGYCSITVVNHRLITVLRFVVKSYIHPWKDFTNKFRLVFYPFDFFLGTRVHGNKQRLGTHDTCLSVVTKGGKQADNDAGVPLQLGLDRRTLLPGQRCSCPVWLYVGAAEGIAIDVVSHVMWEPPRTPKLSWNFYSRLGEISGGEIDRGNRFSFTEENRWFVMFSR